MAWNVVGKIQYGSYRWLMREVAGAAGYGYDPDLLDQNQTSYIDSCVQRGYQNFLYCPSLPPANEKSPPPAPHRWSFLSPTSTLTLIAGTKSYDLPADFCGTLDRFTFQSAVDGSYPIPVVTPDHFRSVAAPQPSATIDPNSVSEPTDTLATVGGMTTVSGQPTIAQIIPKLSVGDTRQQYSVVFYPTPVSAQVLEYRYDIIPAELSDEARFPLGSQVHAETVLASCLYCLESRATNQQQQGSGWQNFMQRLVVSISQDAKIIESQGSSWPHDHVAVGLNVDFFYLQRRIGAVLGYSPNPHSFNHEQANIVKTIIESGLRLYYYPPPIPGMKDCHEWSFLKPTSQMTTVANVRYYPLPVDFERFLGPLTFLEINNSFPPVSLTTESRLRSLEYQTTYTNFPMLAAVRPKASDASGPQVQELVLHPTPDAAYQLGFRYMALQTMISATRPYPLGGPAHAEGILTACLSEAEVYKTNKRGTMYAKFIEQLASKVYLDLRRGGDELGYVGDGTNAAYGWKSSDGYERNLISVTYNGSTGD